MVEQSLATLLAQAGWTMWPLYACSLLALATGLRMAARFQLEGVGRRGALSLVEGPLEDLASRLAGEPGPLARVMAQSAVAMNTLPDRAADAAQRAAAAELDRLEGGQAVLSFVAQVAPLFGLLGTVIGMVDLFSGMEAAGAAVETSTLSSGIWKALLTTAAGLIIAIPTIGLHAWFGRRLDRLALAMEEGVGRVFDRGSARTEAA